MHKRGWRHTRASIKTAQPAVRLVLSSGAVGLFSSMTDVLSIGDNTPKGTKVDDIYQALKGKGYAKGKSAAIAQAQTGLSLQTGKPPKAPKAPKRPAKGKAKKAQSCPSHLPWKP